MDVENTRGVIAQTYHELQAIGVLERSRQAYPLNLASPEIALRAIFQCAEVSLLNLEDLIRRATNDIAADNVDGAVIKLSWARGFHRVMVRLSALPYELGDQVVDTNATHSLSINQSPAYKKFLAAMQSIEAAVEHRIESGQLDLEKVIAEESLESTSFRILHLLRLMFHEHSIWLENLAHVSIPVPVPSHEEFVVTDLMEAAVYDTTLKGDTYFTQFRGLHQVPETLGFEINDRMEVAIRALQAGELSLAIEQMHSINTLSTGILESLPVIADNLSTADYHEIRENLGLTSGSHSVCFHYHMFRDLYEQLAESVNDYLGRNYKQGADEFSLEDTLREAAGKRFENSKDFQVHMLITECLRFRMFTRNWRNLHLHLPRNNLGGEHTKSLTGSKDAISAVRGMFNSAKRRDPFTAHAHARSAGRANGLATADQESGNAMPELDKKILDTTGGITKRRFQAVQDRTGVFATSCPFSTPPKRSA
ncbi:MAG: hypothetical protein ACR2P6_03375 [Gammaproteobacteria bacterium]